MNFKDIDLVQEPDSKSSLRLWIRLLKSSRIIENKLRDKLRREFSTTMPRFDVMAALFRFEKGLKMNELSKLLMVSNGNVTGIVDRLVKDGLIVRMPVAGDRRAFEVRLTKKGQQEFSRQAQEHEIWVDEMLASFCEKDSEELLQKLDGLISALSEPTSEAKK